MNIRSKKLAFAVLCLGACCTDSLFAQVPNRPAQTPLQNSLTVPTTPGTTTPGTLARSNVIRDEAASIQCVHDYPISAQTDGLISEMLTDEGLSVKKGDTLFVIDERVAKVEVSVALKEWEAAKSQANETANVEFAEKSSELADAEFKSESEMYQKGAASKSQTERKKLEAEKARFGIRVSKVEHQKEIKAAEVAAEKHKAAEVRLDTHRVVAFHDGVIVRRLRDEGEWSRAGEPVLQFMGMREMKVQALVPIKGLSVTSLQGAPMRIEVPVNVGEVITFDAKIDYVSPEIEQGKVRVSARVENQAIGGVWILRKGMPATVEITP